MADLSGIDLEQLAFLAVDADQRRQHAAYLSTKAQADYAAASAELARRMGEGEAIPVGDEDLVVCLRGRGTNRSVNREGVLRHAEALEPFGLAPAEKVVLAWPTVNQISAAEHVVRRAGVDPAELITPGTPGELEIRIQQRKATPPQTPAATNSGEVVDGDERVHSASQRRSAHGGVGAR
jgi:hypothetical protein